ncbi:MAG: hypothetical protein ACOZCO_02995 [Bacteroidota bacterium]
MNNRLFLLLFVFCAGIACAQHDSLKVEINDSTVFWHKIKIVKKDTSYGEVKAVYLSDTTRTAFVKHYYNGFQSGVYKSFYPNGKVMEKTVYQKGKKNGEFSLYSFDGTLLVKGEYENDIKNGFWIHRKLKIMGKYKNGLKHGKWKWYYTEDKYYKYYFEEGKLVKAAQPPPHFLLTDFP